MSTWDSMRRNHTTYTLFEVMGYGSIVAKCDEMQIIVTINGAYFNAFLYIGEGAWISVNNCWAPSWSNSGKSRGLYTEDESVRLVNIQEEAEGILEKIRNENNEDDEDIDSVVSEEMGDEEE